MTQAINTTPSFSQGGVINTITATMTQTIHLSLLENNTGQIEGVPKNPRFIKDDKFLLLKKSLTDDPEMLHLRELIVIPHGKKYVVIAGNMRLRAAKELGYKELPCKVIPVNTDARTLRAITVKDNVAYGVHDHELLANEWDEIELESWGVDIPEIIEAEDEPEQPKAISKKLIVECSTAEQLEDLYEEMQNRGFVVSLK